MFKLSNIPSNLKNEIIRIISKHLIFSRYRIFLFGSRVKGNASERSDIDIGIDADASIPLSALTEIEAELDELPILQKIEVVDFNNVSKGFKEVALQNMEVIYEK
jgi:predicted nucleotidyltransferase